MYLQKNMKYSIKILLNSIHILLVCFVGQSYCDICPAPETISPCVCNSETLQIICSGAKSLDLKLIFTKISASGGKNFNELILSNSAVTTLEDHVFGDVSFKTIQITGAHALSKISAQAFSSSINTLIEFRQMGESQLSDENIEPLFDALSSLVSVNRIYLELTKATKVPDNAFKIINGRQAQLENIHLNYIGGKFGSLQSIGSKAFYYLDNLKYISIANQPIKYLSPHAFDFEKYSGSDLDLHMEATSVTGDSFTAGIFLNANRPITIELSNNNIEYLNQTVFEPVFNLAKEKNVDLILQANPLECDCRMEWLVKGKEKYMYQILEPKCKHTGADLWDLTLKDFSKCH